MALVALDAQVQVCSLNGERTIKMCDFYRLPYEAPERDTILEADEIITLVHIQILYKKDLNVLYGQTGLPR